MTLRAAPSDRDVITRSSASRNVDLETRYVIVCVVARVAEGLVEERKKKKVNVYLPSLMMKSTESFICLKRHIYMSHVNKVQRICVKMICIAAIHVTCIMCRLRHINDSVLSLLKKEGIRLFFI
jgi:hypothetical protein